MALRASTFAILLFSFALLEIVYSTRHQGCLKSPPKGTKMSSIKSPLPSEYVNVADLPQQLDWRYLNGKVYVTKIKNQLQPKFCGSCWAMAATSALSDRMKIALNATLPDIDLATQVLLDCGDESGAGGCDGGSSTAANQFMQQTGITDDSCAVYMAADYVLESELPCNQTMCRTCDRFGTCFAIPNATKYYVDEYGTMSGVKAMMAEIYARGPIVCGMYAHSESFEKYHGGIITDPTNYTYVTHAVSLVGWGEQNGIPYWIGRNSFGTHWGELGWFKIERGTNCLLIESGCDWATPLTRTLPHY